MRLMDLTVSGFIAELASNSPAPGGGSVSALAGSMGAALVSMVANLTVGKESCAAVGEKMQEIKRQALVLQERLTRLVDEDTQAFNRVMAAFQLPKSTAAEKEERSRAIQEATKQAALLPLEAARNCLAVMELSLVAVTSGNPNALSDAGVSALMAFAGLQGAVYNVEINLSGIKDQEFNEKLAAEKERLLQQGQNLMNQVQEVVRQKMQ